MTTREEADKRREREAEGRAYRDKDLWKEHCEKICNDVLNPKKIKNETLPHPKG